MCFIRNRTSEYEACGPTLNQVHLNTNSDGTQWKPTPLITKFPASCGPLLISRPGNTHTMCQNACPTLRPIADWDIAGSCVFRTVPLAGRYVKQGSYMCVTNIRALLWKALNNMNFYPLYITDRFFKSGNWYSYTKNIKMGTEIVYYLNKMSFSVLICRTFKCILSTWWT